MKIKQSELLPLVVRLAPQKERIQAALDSGKSVTDWAKENSLPVSTARQVLDAIGVKHGYGHRREGSSPKLFNDLLLVVARIAKELNIQHDEIKPYLQ